MKDKTVLAIETSCDETAVALMSYTDDTYTVLAQELYSQIAIHKEYGGVFPMLAKREHGKHLLQLLENTLSTAKIGHMEPTITEDAKTAALSLLGRESELLEFFTQALANTQSFLYKRPNVDAIAVTVGPGLEPALWVGISFAKALSILWNIDLVPVNHMEGHITSVLIENDRQPPLTLFPALALLISGGHTELVHVTKWGSYNILGGTRDDAVGEAYDKVARILGLEYPGGPAISAKAEHVHSSHGIQEAERMCVAQGIKLPRPMLNSQDTSFSFSGLKTAVLYMVRDLQKASETNSLTSDQVNLICFEFEQAVTEVLLKKVSHAAKHIGAMHSLIVGGGVIANTYIRNNIQTWCDTNNIQFLKPTHEFATDNAVMIAAAALLQLNHSYGVVIPPKLENLNQVIARGGWKIDEIY